MDWKGEGEDSKDFRYVDAGGCCEVGEDAGDEEKGGEAEDGDFREGGEYRGNAKSQRGAKDGNPRESSEYCEAAERRKTEEPCADSLFIGSGVPPGFCSWSIPLG